MIGFESYYDNLFAGAAAAVGSNIHSLIECGELDFQKLLSDEGIEL